MGRGPGRQVQQDLGSQADAQRDVPVRPTLPNTRIDRFVVSPTAPSTPTPMVAVNTARPIHSSDASPSKTTAYRR